MKSPYEQLRKQLYKRLRKSQKDIKKGRYIIYNNDADFINSFGGEK